MVMLLRLLVLIVLPELKVTRTDWEYIYSSSKPDSSRQSCSCRFACRRKVPWLDRAPNLSLEYSALLELGSQGFSQHSCSVAWIHCARECLAVERWFFSWGWKECGFWIQPQFLSGVFLEASFDHDILGIGRFSCFEGHVTRRLRCNSSQVVKIVCVRSCSWKPGLRTSYFVMVKEQGLIRECRIQSSSICKVRQAMNLEARMIWGCQLKCLDIVTVRYSSADCQGLFSRLTCA